MLALYITIPVVVLIYLLILILYGSRKNPSNNKNKNAGAFFSYVLVIAFIFILGCVLLGIFVDVKLAVMLGIITIVLATLLTINLLIGQIQEYSTIYDVFEVIIRIILVFVEGMVILKYQEMFGFVKLSLCTLGIGYILCLILRVKEINYENKRYDRFNKTATAILTYFHIISLSAIIFIKISWILAIVFFIIAVLFRHIVMIKIK